MKKLLLGMAAAALLAPAASFAAGEDSDACSDSTTIITEAAFPFTFSASLGSFTDSGIDVQQAVTNTGGGGLDVFFRIQLSTTMLCTINAAGGAGTTDTAFAVYTGNCSAVVQNNEDLSIDSGLNDSATFTFVGGQEYRLMVEGFSGADTGPLDLTIDQLVLPPPKFDTCDSTAAAPITSNTLPSVTGTTTTQFSEFDETGSDPAYVPNVGTTQQVWWTHVVGDAQPTRIRVRPNQTTPASPNNPLFDISVFDDNCVTPTLMAYTDRNGSSSSAAVAANSILEQIVVDFTTPGQTVKIAVTDNRPQTTSPLDTIFLDGRGGIAGSAIGTDSLSDLLQDPIAGLGFVDGPNVVNRGAVWFDGDALSTNSTRTADVTFVFDGAGFLRAHSGSILIPGHATTTHDQALAAISTFGGSNPIASDPDDFFQLRATPSAGLDISLTVGYRVPFTGGSVFGGPSGGGTLIPCNQILPTAQTHIDGVGAGVTEILPQFEDVFGGVNGDGAGGSTLFEGGTAGDDAFFGSVGTYYLFGIEAPNTQTGTVTVDLVRQNAFASVNDWTSFE